MKLNDSAPLWRFNRLFQRRGNTPSGRVSNPEAAGTAKSKLCGQIRPAGVVDEVALADAGGMFTQVAERTVYYVRWPARGRKLVLVHGFGTATTSWNRVGQLFAEAGYDTYALDLGGFGLSSKRWEDGYAHQDQADLVAAWMQHLGLKCATIIGHSMGGNVAAHLALRHPQRVERLVLEAPAILSGLVTTPRHLGTVLQVPGMRLLARLAVRQMIRRSDLSQFEASNPQVLRVLQTADWDQALVATVRDSWANQLTPDQIRGITVPTLLIWGADDKTIPISDLERLKGLLPHAQSLVMPGLGHIPHEEDPRAFVEYTQTRVAGNARWLFRSQAAPA